MPASTGAPRIFAAISVLSFATWDNSGIEPDEGIGNQLSRNEAILTWPCNDGEQQWNTMLDWTCR